MPINLGTPQTEELKLKPHITVIGVGGAGGNAVSNMIHANLEGAEFVACNTDAQALSRTVAERRVQLGASITQGLGSGSKPDVGRAAAEEAKDEIMDHLSGSHMAFVTAGMGGGTGTGAAPVIAQFAREAGILTVGVVTKPFGFEGAHRMAIAEAGIQELQNYVDTLIVIPNQNLFRVANEKTTFADAFKLADDVLHSGVRGVTDLMVMPGLINLDFADVKAVMEEMGKAMMGTGEAEGDKRALQAAEAAISNPLLEDTSMKGARGILINITGAADITLCEVDEAVNRIREEVDPNANIIFGSTFDERLEGHMRVSIVATGIDVAADAARPPHLHVVSAVSNGAPAGAASERDAENEPGTARAAAEAEARESRHASATVGGAAHSTVARAPEPSATRDPRVGQAGSAAFEPRPASRASGGAQPALRRMEPQHHRAGPPFIAPLPVQASPSLSRTVTDQSAKTPRGGGGALAQRRTPSLLERMTGLGRNGKTDGAGETGAIDEHRAPSVRRSAAAPRTVSEPDTEARAPQLRADAADRAPPPRADDDLLEIPPFLRRQAN